MQAGFISVMGFWVGGYGAGVAVVDTKFTITVTGLSLYPVITVTGLDMGSDITVTGANLNPVITVTGQQI